MTGYGLAAAEILRLRQHKIKVTASVDQVAASGGYMMACAADRIVAAPFASSARSGWWPRAELHRLLKKNDIDYEEMTAGEFKRTVSVLGEITPAGREHFRGKLDARTRRSRPTFMNVVRTWISPSRQRRLSGSLARRSGSASSMTSLTGDELPVPRPGQRAAL